MNFVAVTLGVLLFDRAIPAGAGRFTVAALRPDIENGWRDYGWFRLPRSLFALGVCLCGAVIDFFPNARTEAGLTAGALITAFVVAASLDAWRAFIRR